MALRSTIDTCLCLRRERSSLTCSAKFTPLLCRRGERLGSVPFLVERGSERFGWTREEYQAALEPLTRFVDIASYPGLAKACGAYQMSAEELKAVAEDYWEASAFGASVDRPDPSQTL